MHNFTGFLSAPVLNFQVALILTKEKERQSLALQKHLTMVEAVERKASAKEVDSKVAPFQAKYVQLLKELTEAVSALDV